MLKVKTWLNANDFVKWGEVNVQPSVTIPDQSMSINEILERYAKGLPIGGTRVPVFDEDDDMPDIRRLDLAEREELSDSFLQELRELRSAEAKRKADIKAKKDVSVHPKPDVIPPMEPPSTNVP